MSIWEQKKNIVFWISLYDVNDNVIDKFDIDLIIEICYKDISKAMDVIQLINNKWNHKLHKRKSYSFNERWNKIHIF